MGTWINVRRCRRQSNATHTADSYMYWPELALPTTGSQRRRCVHYIKHSHCAIPSPSESESLHAHPAVLRLLTHLGSDVTAVCDEQEREHVATGGLSAT